jgi:hypothetical protein
MREHVTEETLSLFIEGRLADTDLVDVAAHIKSCSQCGAEYLLGLEVRDRRQAGLLPRNGLGRLSNLVKLLVRPGTADTTTSALFAGLAGFASGRAMAPGFAAFGKEISPEPVSFDHHHPSDSTRGDDHTSGDARHLGEHTMQSSAACDPGLAPDIAQNTDLRFPYYDPFEPRSSQIEEAPHEYGEPIRDARVAGPNARQEHSDTCAIRCQEFILREFLGYDIPEEKLVEEAIDHGWYDGRGTTPADVGKLLELHGVPVHRYSHANTYNLATELAQGHKVIIGVNAEELWHSDNPVLHSIAAFAGWDSHDPDHAVMVTGIDTTDPKDVKVIVNDPGSGDVHKEYPLKQFLHAWQASDFYMVSTQGSAPPTASGMTNFDYETGHLHDVVGIPFEQFVEMARDPQLFVNTLHANHAPAFQYIDPFSPEASHHLSPGEIADRSTVPIHYVDPFSDEAVHPHEPYAASRLQEVPPAVLDASEATPSHHPLTELQPHATELQPYPAADTTIDHPLSDSVDEGSLTHAIHDDISDQLHDPHWDIHTAFPNESANPLDECHHDPLDNIYDDIDHGHHG